MSRFQNCDYSCSLAEVTILVFKSLDSFYGLQKSILILVTLRVPQGETGMTCKNTVKWLYRSDKNFIWQSDLRVNKDYVFRDKNGIIRLIIETDGRLTVTRGYAWNGCSPKICIFDLLIGTPDGAVYEPTGRPKTYFASMVHDALYQFLDSEAPITQEQADKCFLQLMEESEFILAGIYWIAVRMFGHLFWHRKKAVRRWRGEAVPVQSL